jgi:two-component system sensor histidine kinase PilS (NtrC family)
MSGCIELLRGNASLSAQDARLMDIVLREAGRLEDLVTRFLQFSRPAPPRREEVDLAQVATETLEVFARDPAAAAVEVATELLPAPAWCDPDHVRQVLWNLLLNAAQAIAGAREDDGAAGHRVRVLTAVDAAGAASIAVEDDGPGMTRDELSHLFTPFFTTKDSGTGLGLATVHRIVDAHGGTVAVESAPGKGTRFTVRLPRRAPLERAAG